MALIHNSTFEHPVVKPQIFRYIWTFPTVSISSIDRWNFCLSMEMNANTPYKLHYPWIRVNAIFYFFASCFQRKYVGFPLGKPWCFVEHAWFSFRKFISSIHIFNQHCLALVLISVKFKGWLCSFLFQVIFFSSLSIFFIMYFQYSHKKY